MLLFSCYKMYYMHTIIFRLCKAFPCFGSPPPTHSSTHTNVCPACVLDPPWLVCQPLSRDTLITSSLIHISNLSGFTYLRKVVSLACIIPHPLIPTSTYYPLPPPSPNSLMVFAISHDGGHWKSPQRTMKTILSFSLLPFKCAPQKKHIQCIKTSNRKKLFCC